MIIAEAGTQKGVGNVDGTGKSWRFGLGVRCLMLQVRRSEEGLLRGQATLHD